MKSNLDIVWVLGCSVLVFIMQAGFCCLETGMVRSKNSINVAVKNILDFSVSSLLFWMFGFCLMFGIDFSDMDKNSSLFFFHTGDNRIISFFIFQMFFCGTAVTIISGAVAERLRLFGYLFIALIISGIVYPVFGNWAWGGSLGNEPLGWLSQLGFFDYAGSTVVHSIGAWAALAIVIIIGPRTGWKKESKHIVKGNNYPVAILGLFLLAFGWLGFNGGSSFEFNGQIPSVFLNTILAGCCGCLSAFLGSCHFYNGKSKVDLLINGTIAGFVGITASANSVSPIEAQIIGFISGIIVIFGERFIRSLGIDDVVGVISCHGFAGIWGTLSVALFGDSSNWINNTDRIEQLFIQIIGVVVCFLWSFGLTYVLASFFNKIFPLRVCMEDEYKGLNVSEHGASTEILNLLEDMEKKSTGDYSNKVFVEPFTEIGQIAQKYNQVIEKIKKREKQLQISAIESRSVIDTAFDAFISADSLGIIKKWNKRAEEIFGWSEEEALGRGFHSLIVPEKYREDCRLGIERAVNLVGVTKAKQKMEFMALHKDHREIPVEISISPLVSGDKILFNAFISDITERRNLQIQLNHVQKLESIGQLAAGIAHEINTPLQFIGDNTRFIQDSMEELIPLINEYQILNGNPENEKLSMVLKQLEERYEEKDVGFLLQEIPDAIEQSLEGIGRVTKIVGAMKEFSHPGMSEKKLNDINKAIETTINVSRNEWKYVAELDTDLASDLPLTPCYLNDINQVILNLIVNGAHSIKDKLNESENDKGKIAISSRMKGDNVEIRIADTGMGIPEEIRPKIFDPFFTTKEVGRGTGQGLSIAHTIVVKKHQGTIDFETEVGKGTIFTIRLPINKENI
jgi:ammonium transporter, Amt family